MPTFSYAKTDGSFGTTNDKKNAPGIAANSGFIEGAITPSSLKPVSPIRLPQAPAYSDAATPFAGGTAMLGANDASLARYADAAPATDGLTSLFDKYINSQPAPPSSAELYSGLYKNSGIDSAQDDLAQKQKAVKQAQSALDSVNANITGIVAEGQAMNLRQDGRQAPLSVIQGSQAENNRQTAIRALPLQIQALTAQAKVASAQGDAELAQGILTQAENHLDKVFGIMSADAQAQYQYKTKLVDTVYQFATDQEKRRLDDIRIKEDRAFQLQLGDIDFQRQKELLNLKASLETPVGAPTQSFDQFLAERQNAAGMNFVPGTTEYNDILADYQAGGGASVGITAQPAYASLTAAQKPQATGLNDLVNALNEYRDYYDANVGDSGRKLTGTEAAVLETKLNSLLFAAAVAEGTGALQKADREVLEKVIPNPTTLGGATSATIKGGKTGGLAKLDDQIAKYNSKLTTLGLVATYQRIPQNDEDIYNDVLGADIGDTLLQGILRAGNPFGQYIR